MGRTGGLAGERSPWESPNLEKSALDQSNATKTTCREQTYREALSFLYKRINYERLASQTSAYPFRLQRTGDLLNQMGLGAYLHSEVTKPKVPIVHIAGTKGKGSTASLVAAGLSAAGLRTGLYTSPHLIDLEERFQVDGQPCSQSQLVDLVADVEPAVELIGRESDVQPSFFELTTCLALKHFDKSECDAIVLEVGLGGRLDSTNVCAPSVAAVTSIGLDHQHVLGDTLPEIAAEKSGIIKSPCPVVSGVQTPEAAEVIARKAAEQSANLFQLGRDFDFDHRSAPDWGCHVDFKGTTSPLEAAKHIALKLEGRHQAKNASLALVILYLLRDQGMQLNIDQAVRGMSNLSCPARLERFEISPKLTVIVDAAHNTDSIAALCHCVQARRGDRPVAVVFGTSRDKDAIGMVDQIAQIADHIVLTHYEGNPRFLPPNDLVSSLSSQLKQRVIVNGPPIEACEFALNQLQHEGLLVICGSFFLAAETRQWAAQRESMQ